MTTPTNPLIHDTTDTTMDTVSFTVLFYLSCIAVFLLHIPTFATLLFKHLKDH